MKEKINGLSLCSGVGGLELGLYLALGKKYRCVGYCEREAYASSVIVARMEDSTLDKAPIYGDIATFPSALYRGKVDILSAGFPCQPWSVAGKKQGTADDRYLWDDILRVIDDVQPRTMFFENVPGLLSSYGGTCVCGWPDRWGGLHRNRVSQAEILFSKSRCWNDGNSIAVAEQTICDIRRECLPIEKANGEMGSSVSLDSGRESSSGFLSLHRSIVEAQAKASRDRLDAWVKWKNEGANPCTKPERPISHASWVVCPACGRKVDNSSDVIRAIAGILGSLADLGFDAAWGLYGAWQVGAPHRRDRIFILAWRIPYSELDTVRQFAKRGIGATRQTVERYTEFGDVEQKLADSERQGCEGPARTTHEVRDGFVPESAELANGDGARREGVRHAKPAWVAFPPGSNTPPECWPELCPQPSICRSADGVSYRLDRLRCLGNGVVPSVAALAFVDLLVRACDSNL